MKNILYVKLIHFIFTSFLVGELVLKFSGFFLFFIYTFWHSVRVSTKISLYVALMLCYKFLGLPEDTFKYCMTWRFFVVVKPCKKRKKINLQSHFISANFHYHNSNAYTTSSSVMNKFIIFLWLVWDSKVLPLCHNSVLCRR